MSRALTCDEHSLMVRINGREVEIKSQDNAETLRTAKWIVLTTGGFISEEDAQSFGERLKSIVSIAGMCTRNGVDVGEDRATTFIDESWAREIGLIRPEERIHPNVHGLIVFPDDRLSRFPLSNPSVVVTADPASFVSAIEELGHVAPQALVVASAGVRILNLALKSQEPLTRVVLAISVIEALGQEENWTESQRAILSSLAIEVESTGGTEEKEIAEALRRSLHRIGLRQGVLRVLARLGLEHRKKQWDKIYGLRSSVFHGTQQIAEHEMHELAQSSITLCGQILIALLIQGGVAIPSVARKHFPDLAA